MKYSGILSFILVLTLFSSCEKKELKQSDIRLVPVYNISNIQGDETAFAIDVYREEPFVIVYPSSNELMAYEVVDYLDNSTDAEYHFSFVKSTQTTTEEGDNKIYAVETYNINGNEDSGLGVMTIKSVNGNGNVSTENYTVTIKKEKRYR